MLADTPDIIARILAAYLSGTSDTPDFLVTSS